MRSNKNKKNKKITFGVLVLITIILAAGIVFMLFYGQVDNNNSVLKSLGIDNVEDNAIAVIVNNPTKEELKKIPNLKTYEYDRYDESLLIIPIYKKMNVEIKTLAWDNDDLKEDETLYKEENTKDGSALLLKAYRPEGIPSLKICVDGENMDGEYILTYDGKDGTPDIEYIMNKVENNK